MEKGRCSQATRDVEYKLIRPYKFSGPAQWPSTLHPPQEEQGAVLQAVKNRANG